jgi:hypothetical protein
MALNFPEMLNKLFDNANAGVAVTHVGTGFALSVPLLMMVSLATGVSVLPADAGYDLRREMGAARYEVLQAKLALAAPLAPVLERSCGCSTGKASGECAKACQLLDSVHKVDKIRRREGEDINKDLDELYTLARQHLAALGAELEVVSSQVQNELKSGRGGPELKNLLASKLTLTRLNDPLLAQRDAVDAARERQKTVENELKDANTFSVNLEMLTNKITAVMAFSVVIGVVLSQLSRLIFMHWLFDTLLRLRRARTHVQALAAPPAGKTKEELQKTRDELISGYYRYAEGCVNMIAPVLLFGIVFPVYAHKNLEVAETWLWILRLACYGGAALLLCAGYITYKDYRKKLADADMGDAPDPVSAML